MPGDVKLYIPIAVALYVLARWWWRRKSAREAEGWPATQATIESGRLEELHTGRSRRELPTFAFSYQVAGQYYSGRFALSPAPDSESALIDRMIGRKLQVRYKPGRPEVWFIPDGSIEGYEVLQKISQHFRDWHPED